MARKSHQPESDALDQIEGSAEMLARWIQERLAVVLGVLFLLIAGVGAITYFGSASESREQEASLELESIRAEFLSAMGATPESGEIPELANPEAGREIRADFVQRFREMAEQHPDTVAATLARLEIGTLLEQDGEREAAIETWQAALEPLAADSTLRAVLLRRIAQAHEEAERWQEAARHHELAGQIESFPLRYVALGDAARCYDAAAEPLRALELLEQVEQSENVAVLSDDMRTRLLELKAIQP